MERGVPSCRRFCPGEISGAGRWGLVPSRVMVVIPGRSPASDASLNGVHRALARERDRDMNLTHCNVERWVQEAVTALMLSAVVVLASVLIG